MERHKGVPGKRRFELEKISVSAAAVLIAIYALVVGVFDIVLAFYAMAKKHEIEKAYKEMVD